MPVTNLKNTFVNCSNLVVSPQIPSSIRSIDYTFYGCSSLTSAPEILPNVSSMNNTFSGCSSLTSAPEIPVGVYFMTSTFANCTNSKGEVIIKSYLVDDVINVFLNITNNLTVKVPESSQTYSCIVDEYRLSPNITIVQFVPQNA